MTKTKTFVVDYQDGTLKGQWEPMDGCFKHFAMVRVAPASFVPGVYDEQGLLYEVLRPDVTIEFTRVNGRPMTCEWRDENDKVFARGRRLP